METTLINKIKYFDTVKNAKQQYIPVRNFDMQQLQAEAAR